MRNVFGSILSNGEQKYKTKKSKETQWNKDKE